MFRKVSYNVMVFIVYIKLYRINNSDAKAKFMLVPFLHVLTAAIIILVKFKEMYFLLFKYLVESRIKYNTQYKATYMLRRQSNRLRHTRHIVLLFVRMSGPPHTDSMYSCHRNSKRSRYDNHTRFLASFPVPRL